MDAQIIGNQVSPTWLAERLHQPDLVVVDGSWYLPADGRDARAEYAAYHIPGAVFFDLDAIADTSAGLPHMLASPERFTTAMRDLGIGDGARVVVYDGAGLFSAARVWWTLKAFGIREVAVLKGGLPRWRAEGRPCETGTASRPPTLFTPHFDTAVVASAASVAQAANDQSAQIIDARSGIRFRGETIEPRPGVRPGHIPGSINLHYADLIEAGSLRPRSELEQAFRNAGADLEKPIITTCGSGVTAAILVLALAELGRGSTHLYDGSWSEWGSRPDLPVAVGPAAIG